MSAALQATVIFPPQSFIDPINTKDSINVTYQSAWPLLNLTVLCIGSPNSNNLLYHNINENPVQGTGSYITPSIESMGFRVEQYPTQCKIRLTEYGENDIKVDGGDFILTSIKDKAAATYEQTTTILPTETPLSNRTLIVTDTHTPPSPPPQTPTISSSTSATAFSFPFSTLASTPTPSSSSFLSTSTSTSSSSSQYPGVLNRETSAAIGIGVALGVVLTILITLWIFLLARRRQRRRRRRQIETAKRSSTSTPDDHQPIIRGKSELCGSEVYIVSPQTPQQHGRYYQHLRQTSPQCGSGGDGRGKEMNPGRFTQSIMSPIYNNDNNNRADRVSPRHGRGTYLTNTKPEGEGGGQVHSRYELECRVKNERLKHEARGGLERNFSRPRHELA